jgi:hypothetical protein
LVEQSRHIGDRARAQVRRAGRPFSIALGLVLATCVA